MKSLVQAVVLAVAVASPVAVFAQSADQGLTREQVRAQLVEFQQISRDQVAGADAMSAPAAQGDTSFGGVQGTTSMSGRGYAPEAARRGPQSVFFGGA
jgi:hypothetical protein